MTERRAKGSETLRESINAIADQLCRAVDGDFDFAVRSNLEDETLEKLSMLVNFVLDTARRGMSALREHNAALAELDRAKTIFFSNVSHEFRTPLTLMLGPLEDALAGRNGELSPELRQQLDVTHRNALRVLKLVNTLLEFSRSESGRAESIYEPTDLAGLTQDLASTFRSAVERAGLRLVVDCPPLPKPLYVDRVSWERVVLNLLSNALKFTFEGEIHVELRWKEDHAELLVRDTGIGIAAEEQTRVFERFHRIEGARSRSHEGSGIGLALVREIAQQHGGTAFVTSRAGNGASVGVTVRGGTAHLPPGRVREQPSALALGGTRAEFVNEALQWSAEEVPALPSPVGEDAARILVVDDNADMRGYLVRVLGRQWRIETAPDGAQALAAIARAAPDLVLSDVMMPGVDGMSLIRALRAKPETREIPVVLLSARAGEEAKIEGLGAGADDYLAKPFSARELVARIGSQLRLVNMRRELAQERSEILERERHARQSAELESRINKALYRISVSFSNETDPETLLQLITDEATELTGAEFGAFFFNARRPDGEKYLLYTLSGARKDDFKGFPPPRVTPLFEPTFRGDGILRLDDVRKDPRFGRWGNLPPGHIQVVSYLATPVVGSGGGVLGGLFFGHREPARFTEAHERIVAGIAAQAANALEKAQLYQDLREKEERARAAYDHAQEADRRKDEFLAMLGHELRNPLAPILTAVQLMAARPGVGASREREVIERQVRHLVRLVDDLLDISRITRGKIQLERSVIDVSTVVVKAVEMVSPLLERSAHTLTLEVPAGLWVDADSVRLSQVFANLLSNAARYTDRGGRIEVRGREEAGNIVVSVKDNGQGIAPELLPRIFDLFVQDERGSDRAQGGLGIGLTLVRSLTDLHGGRVRARSEGRGKGAEFIVELAAAAAPMPVETVAGVPTPTAAVHGRRILLVDDNRDAALLLAGALREAGHDVEVVHDGPAALAVAARFAADVAFLDIGLPVMDGYDLAVRIRQVWGEREVFLAALTGYGTEADKRRGREAGFHAHLVKPVDLTTVLGVIANRRSP